MGALRRLKLFGTFLLVALLAALAAHSLAFAQTTETTQETTPPEKIELSSSYPEIKGAATDKFEFKVECKYSGPAEERVFNITTQAPDGWYALVTPSYESTEISAVRIKPGFSETIKISLIPLIKVKPGEYPLKVTLESDGLKQSIDLKAIVKATYELALESTSGRLNTNVTVGRPTVYTIKVTNKGTDTISNISLSVDKPEGWTVTLKPSDKIDSLKAGESKNIDVTINPPSRTIAGDYMMTVSANSDKANESIDVRVTVLTPTLWGWIGLIIIVLVVIGVAYTFVRLGRR